jgi:hypothetical protein
MAGIELSARQQSLLNKLPEYDSRVVVKKNEASMTDLAALTAKTGDEFAMFTKGHVRLIVRGNAKRVNITRDYATVLSTQGYKWSGHTHVGLRDGWELSPSDGDIDVLNNFNQKESVIYNVKGQHQTFENTLGKEQNRD